LRADRTFTSHSNKQHVNPLRVNPSLPTYSLPYTTSHTFYSTILLLFHPVRRSLAVSRRTQSLSFSGLRTILPIARHVPHPILSGDGCPVFCQFQKAQTTGYVSVGLPPVPTPVDPYLPGCLALPSHPLTPLPMLHQRQMSMALQILCPALSSMPLSFFVFYPPLQQIHLSYTALTRSTSLNGLRSSYARCPLLAHEELNDKV